MFQVYNPVPMNNNTELGLSTGKVEILNWYERFNIEVARGRIDPATAQAVERWYNYCKAGASFSFVYDMGLAFYIGMNGEELLTNDRGAITTTRAGADAYYQNPSTGFIEAAAANTPRFESGKFGAALLSERAGTNLCQRSSEVSHAAWTKVTCSATADVAFIEDPANGNTADMITSSGTNWHAAYNTGVAATGRGVASIYAKARYNTEAITLRLTGSSGGPESDQAATLTTGDWQRIQVANTNLPTGNWQVEIQGATAGQNVLVWGVQIEDGRSVASSYMPGSGAVGTRTAGDVHTLTVGSGVVNPMRGSVAFWLYPQWVYNNGRQHSIIRLGTSSDYAVQIVKNSGNNFEVSAKLAGSTQIFHIATNGSFINSQAWNHFAFTWDYEAGSTALYHNGTERSTGSQATEVVQPVTAIQIGDATNGMDGKIDDICVWRNPLSATEVGHIYNLGKAIGYGRNRWDALRVKSHNLKQNSTNLYDWAATFEEIIS
jgi:hypothetical protein